MKTKSRLGKTDSIFASTITNGQPAEESSTAKLASPASPSIENKMTIIMPPEQVASLDRLCLDIRLKTKAKIRRTELIRAFVAGVQAAEIDLTAYETEAAIAEAIEKRLKG